MLVPVFLGCSLATVSRMSSMNKYGLDFLKSEHLDGDRVGLASASVPLVENLVVDAPPPDIAAAVANKPDLEKQFDVMHFLQAHRSSGYLAPSVIYKATEIDLSETDENVAKMLERNPKIRVEQVPDPEDPSIMIATYAYQAKYNHVRDRTTLLAQINRCKNGVAMRDLVDAYDGVEKDLAALITAGDVLALRNPEDKDKILFPRGEPFLVELDGIITVKEDTPELISNGETNKDAPKDTNGNGNKPSAEGDDLVNAAIERAKMDALRKRKSESCYILETDIDPRKQVRRGEAICAGGQWFRVSSAVQEGPLSDQPVRAQAPLSVTSLTDLSQRNEVDGYIRPFSEKQLPVDAPLLESAKVNLWNAKEAREKLHKLAGGRGMAGGAAAQLLSSHAHAANPTTLAASFASTAGTHHGSGASAMRKRLAAQHHKASHHGPAAAHAAQARKDAEAAQRAASDPALTLYSHSRRHGCTTDVRNMYLATRQKVPESETDLYNAMLEHKLLEPGEKMRRPRLAKKPNVDNDGKPKKQRYYVRKNQRRTNVHLDGTLVGAELARATELQRQGKAVGDGGM